MRTIALLLWNSFASYLDLMLQQFRMREGLGELFCTSKITGGLGSLAI